MNAKLEKFKKSLLNKKVAVVGIGISNTPLIKYLAGLGADITAFDRADEKELKAAVDSFSGLDIKYRLGEDYLKYLEGFDMIFKTPKIRFDIPELLKEKERGAYITSEMQEFFDLCPARIFAVTGSDGKTTTTTLINNILREQGYKCRLGGNIGTPLLDRIDEIDVKDMVVLELSSFQLQTMTRSPDVAVITNISPNHLDVHKSMDEYTAAKKNIFRYQSESNRLILNYDNSITREFIREARGETIYFSRVGNPISGIYISGNRIIYKKAGIKTDKKVSTGTHKEMDTETGIINIDDILLPGAHNIENYLAAIAATIGYVGAEAVYRVASTFKGVEHRIELVRELNGIKYYNDSIATSPTRTIAGLNSFNQKVILIAGGKDKNNRYEELGKTILDKVKCLILIGQTTPLIEGALIDEAAKSGKKVTMPVIKSNTYEDAVKYACDNAVSGDIIILSPAGTSFDMFKNFEERGNKFKQVVNNLK